MLPPAGTKLHFVFPLAGTELHSVPEHLHKSYGSNDSYMNKFHNVIFRYRNVRLLSS